MAWGSAREHAGAGQGAERRRTSTVREAVLDALAVLKDPATAEAVAARLVDTRDKAAAALKAIGRPAEAAAMKYLTHDDIWVRTEACKVLEDDRRQRGVQGRRWPRSSSVPTASGSTPTRPTRRSRSSGRGSEGLGANPSFHSCGVWHP